MSKNIKVYQPQKVKENEEFETKFYDVGDGLSISTRANNEK